ncbi:MAG TPA: AsmA family protein [Vicinamibacterales bacterium]|nr:AsmA family protein [Vicinamibacterales bacterium]
MRKLLIGVAAVIVLVAIAVPILFWILLDEDRLRARATEYVRAQTGRELRIEGPIDLAFFPWLGAELKGVSIGEPGQTGGDPLARFGEIGLKVKLLPLLRSREIEVGGIRGSGGTLRTAGYELRDLSVSTAAFGGSAPTDVSLRFNLAPSGAATTTPVSLDGRMVFDIARQALDLSDVNGSIGEMSFTAALRGTRVLEAPEFEGRVESQRFDLRKLLAQTGTPYVPAGANAMTSASLSAQLATSAAAMRLDNLVFLLDGSRITGSATMKRGPRPEWDAAVQVDSLDVDRYLPGTQAAPSEPAAADPYAALRELTGRARLQVRALRAFGLQLTNVSATLAARNGMITVTPIRAALYSGAGELSGQMDARHRAPAYRVEGRLSRVSFQPLLTDAQSITALSGTGDVSIRLEAAGADPARIMESVDGRVAMTVSDGRIEGADFLRMLARARSMADQIRGRPAAVEADPADRTKFTRLTGTGSIENGVLRTDDLVLVAPDLEAAGEGTIDLARDQIQMVLRARSDQAGNVAVPIAISGPFNAPSYQVQAGALLRDAAKEELKKRLERGLRGLIKKPIGDR